MIHEEENKEPLPGAGDAEPNSVAKQPQTTNYKPATEEMEVHHHSHPSHGKKTWKEYSWEFHDVSIQQDLAYCINQIKGSNIILTTRLKWLLEKAKNTIEFLQKEYHLN